MRDCAHGQLARSCELCEKDDTIAHLQAELVRARDYLEADGHNQTNTDCLACEAFRTLAILDKAKNT